MFRLCTRVLGAQLRPRLLHLAAITVLAGAFGPKGVGVSDHCPQTVLPPLQYTRARVCAPAPHPSRLDNRSGTVADRPIPNAAPCRPKG